MCTGLFFFERKSTKDVCIPSLGSLLLWTRAFDRSTVVLNYFIIIINTATALSIIEFLQIHCIRVIFVYSPLDLRILVVATSAAVVGDCELNLYKVMCIVDVHYL